MLPQMAPLYWSLSLISVWFLMFFTCAMVWWMLGSKGYSFSYKG
uniref:ATPase subunit 8 n=1 Tax=Hiatula acuta TaxID=2341034 RepID=A0A4P8L139_9BIVA|nr:ATP synthase F0 subunit 8 [Hiatula acuta]QCQ20456.1 ATPase subunit 8 [Hiatula acuta]